MCVWVIQLKDNRKYDDFGKEINKFDSDKFDFCFDKNRNGIGNIIGIGWKSVNEETEKAFNDAKFNFDNMKNGDLVWIKNPSEKIYYLCIVTDDKLVYTFDKPQFTNIDISQYKEVKILKSVLADDLPLNYRHFVSYKTIRKIKRKSIVEIETLKMIK